MRTFRTGWRSSVENMLASMDEAGVERAVIQAEYGGSGDYRALNAAAARIAHDHADRFPVTFMCLNPLLDEDMVKVLAWCH